MRSFTNTPVLVAASALVVVASMVPLFAAGAAPWYTQVQPLSNCNNNTLDPYTGCQCPYGQIPSDTGCCKKRCESSCNFPHGRLLRSTSERGQMDTCQQERVCSYVWGDPHMKYHDFKFDPQWNGWMLLTQCDGLKVFSYTRKATHVRGMTVQSKLIIQYRTTVIHVEHDFVSKPPTMVVKGLDASQGKMNLQPVTLPGSGDSVTIGRSAAEVTVSRINGKVIQICTSQGDTLTITRQRHIELNVQMCLTTTCNLRATGYMGIHGAILTDRFPLPGSMVSHGKLPRNGSPYFAEYLKAWYGETNRQLKGIYNINQPAPFPQVDAERCTGWEAAPPQTAAPPPGPEATKDNRYQAFQDSDSGLSQEEAHQKCVEKGGYLATVANQTDFEEMTTDLLERGAPIYRAFLGGSDVDEEGTWIWKYGPPYNLGKLISTGNGRSGNLECKQDKCFWDPLTCKSNSNPAGGNGNCWEPNNWGSRGEHTMVIWKYDVPSWNDLYDNGANGRYVCEFPQNKRLPPATPNPVTPAPPAEQTINDDIKDALDDIGVNDDIDKHKEDQENPSDGDCTWAIQECKSLGAPATIWEDNSAEDACVYCQEWIVAYEVNKTADPEDRYPPRYNDDDKEKDEKANECGAGKHYCDACKDGKPGCFTCSLPAPCADGQIELADAATGTCSCAAPTPECTRDFDCEFSVLQLQSLKACQRIGCDEGECKILKQPSTKVCRPANSAISGCDKAENCTGTSDECPTDTGAVCTTPAPTTAAPATPVPTVPGDCDKDSDCPNVTCGQVFCNKEKRNCVIASISPSSQICRAAVGDCDKPEYCDGQSVYCPRDSKFQGTICRPDAGPCDWEEACDGISNDCPADIVKNYTYVCRVPAAACDAPEYCTGVAGDVHCPDDKMKEASFVCRPSTSDCDPAETCTGASVECPADAVCPPTPAPTTNETAAPEPGAPECAEDADCGKSGACGSHVCQSGTCALIGLKEAGTVCRASAGACDAEDTCDGVTAVCRDKKKVGAICRPDAGPCDWEEACDGISNDCPADKFKNYTVVCRHPAAICDAPEYCTGFGAACPEDKLRAGDFVCRRAARHCDPVEKCNGASVECPADVGCPPPPPTDAPATQPPATQAPPPPECSVDTDCPTATCGDFACVEAKCVLMTLRANGTLCRPSRGACDVDDVCDGVSAVCRDIKREGYVCRPAAGPCDLEEACLADSDVCPEDKKKEATVICRGSAAVCDAPEFCTGTTNQCPSDAVFGSSKVCRASARDCDPAESCDGTNVECPTDAGCPAPSTETPATDAPTTQAPPPPECTSSADCPRDVCGGFACNLDTKKCVLLHVQSNTTLCRPSRGSCDAEDFCDGTSIYCADKKLTQGSVCRPDAGPCDVEEVCDGSSKECPADKVKESNVICRHPAAACDAPEFCSGTDAACPADAKKPATFECRPVSTDAARSACDQAEFCTGDQDECPADRGCEATPIPATPAPTVATVSCNSDADCSSLEDANPCASFACNAFGKCFRLGYKARGTVCRASAGACDVEDVCTGEDSACVDHKKNGHVCRPDAGPCDWEEACDGISNHCPADVKKNSSHTCRAVAGDCDVAEVCDGSNVACPADELKPSDTVCRGSAGPCDIAETCNGKEASCPADHFKAVNTVCRASAEPCDMNEYCPGGSAACPADTGSDCAQTPVPPPTQPPSPDLSCVSDSDCGAKLYTGSCQQAVCLQGNCTNVARPNGFICRASAGTCDEIEYCNGEAAECPANVFKRSVCRPAVGPCDVEEACLGNSSTCPPDTLKSHDTVCRASAGDCDIAEKCSGESVHCPSDRVAPNTTVCRRPAGDCDVTELCTGIHAHCPADRFKSVNEICRPSRGPCDAAERCTAGAECPADRFESNATVCRAADDFCDVEERCTGADDYCPSDARKDVGTVCGQADVNNKCGLTPVCARRGSGPAAPVYCLKPLARNIGWRQTINGLEKTCGMSTSVISPVNTPFHSDCDGSRAGEQQCFFEGSQVEVYQCERLTGDDRLLSNGLTANGCVRQDIPQCVVDSDCIGMIPIGGCESPVCTQAGVCRTEKKASGTACRPKAGMCDIAETCNGVDAECPADKMHQGLICRPATGPCDLEEACSGIHADCPVDVLKSSEFICRGSAGDCDPAEHCTGESIGCPADELAPSTHVCRATVGDCDVTDYCTGAHASCPHDAYVPANTVCRAARLDAGCDVAEVCSGINPNCPADTLAANGTVCRAATGSCDVDETCDGVSEVCPRDTMKPSGFVCRATTDLCDIEDVCTGMHGMCSSKRKDHVITFKNTSSGETRTLIPGRGDMPYCLDLSIASEVKMFQCQKLTGASAKIETSLTERGCPVWPPECKVDADCATMLSSDACEYAVCSAGKCVNELRNSSFVCREANGACDAREFCTGANAACPADGFLNGPVCRPAAGPCDAEEACQGHSAACPEDVVRNSSFVCRASAGDCDVAERCDGTMTECPGDILAPAGITCRASAGPCDRTETCDGNKATCPADHFKNQTELCRPARGQCDNAEYCSAGSAFCPEDTIKANLTVCRASASACDAAEMCDGVSDDCPVDRVKPEGTLCRAASSTNKCDEADYCNGLSAGCADFAREFRTARCEYADQQTGTCSIEACQQSPQQTWFQCGQADGTDHEVTDMKYREVQDPITETTSYCPILPPQCRVDADCEKHLALDACERPVCNAQGRCEKALHNSTTVCRASLGDCDKAEYCTGASSACPADLLQPRTHACRTKAGACDAIEFCDGVSLDCPADEFAGIEVTCRAAAGPCDKPDVCDSTSVDCPADELYADTVLCRDAAGSCDIPDYCTGSSVLCPADALKPSNTPCRAAAAGDLCDVPELCTGNSAVCPDDAMRPEGYVCRAAQGGCDAAEVCSGATKVCPADAIKPAGAVCGDAKDLCDKQDTCDGSTKTCTNVRADYTFTFTAGSDGKNYACGKAVDGFESMEHPKCLSEYSSNCFATSDSNFKMYQCQLATGELKLSETTVLDSNQCFQFPAQCTADEDCATYVAAAGCQEPVCENSRCSLKTRAAGHVCRAANSTCDVEETCDGTNTECPADGFAAAGTQCRTDAGPCDIAEFCTGVSSECPPDAKKAQDQMCRGSAGACDVAEFCDGESNDCPTDVFAPTTKMCRPATVGFTCDEPDFCTGTSYACPNDRVRVENAVCQTFEGEISSCDGISKRCSSARVTVTRANNAVTEVPAEAVTGEDGTTLTGRAATFACDGTCYLCGATADDVVFSGADETAKLKGAGQEASMGLCSSFVILPYPRCLESCVSRTCPNNKPVEKTTFYRSGAAEFKSVRQSTGSQQTCPPWDHVPADEAQPNEGVAGGDPRYSVNGEIVQCDVLGEVLYAQNSHYSVYTNHAAIGSRGATYIDKMRVVFAKSYGLAEVALSNEGWSSTTLKTADGKSVTVHAGGVLSTDIPISLTVEVTAGKTKMINFGLTAKGISSGLMVNGCPEQSPVATASVPENPKCANLAAHLKTGCNFDMWATDGDEDIAEANIAMANLVELVEYQQPQQVPVTQDMKKSQTEAPASTNAASAGKKAQSNQGADGVNTTALAISGAVGFAIVSVLAVVFVVRRRRSSTPKTEEDMAASKSMKATKKNSDPDLDFTGVTTTEMDEVRQDAADDGVVKFVGDASLSGRNPMHMRKRKSTNFNDDSMSLSASAAKYQRPNSGGNQTVGDKSVNELSTMEA